MLYRVIHSALGVHYYLALYIPSLGRIMPLVQALAALLMDAEAARFH